MRRLPTRPSLIRLTLVTSLVASPCLWSRLAHAADPDPAQAFFDRGVKQLDAGLFDKACPDIEASYKLDPRPGTLFTLAECEAKRSRLATALGRYDEYLALYATLPADKKQKQADREKVSRVARTALLAQVPELTVTLPRGAPPGTVVTRDGTPLAATALGTATRVDPGEHVFTVQAPGAAAIEKRVTVRKGEKQSLVLELEHGSGATPAIDGTDPLGPAPVSPSGGRSGRRTAAFVSGGVGVVGVLIGAVAGGLALGKKSTIDQSCGAKAGFTDPTACNRTGIDAANSLSTLGAVSTAGFVIGGAGLVTGVILFATEPRAREAASRRRWISAGVLSAGPGGSSAGVQGAW